MKNFSKHKCNIFRISSIKYRRTSGATTIVQLPLAFVRSGSIGLSGGQIWYVGEYSFGWARTVYSPTFAYYLNADATVVNPSVSSARYNGLPLRCRTGRKDTKEWRIEKIAR